MKEIVILAVGDIALDMKDDRNPFRMVKEDLADKDILFGNLEVVLTDDGIPKRRAVILRASPCRARHLRDSGFDILNLANNHAFDFGAHGLKNTLRSLAELSIASVGATVDDCGSLFTVIDRKGVKVGFLAYASGTFFALDSAKMGRTRRKTILRDIRTSRSRCDILIVSIHWGIENSDYPSPRQIELAHSLVDEGADIVLGHGPHVIQAIERYHRGIIAYSLGNFNFDRQLSYTISDSSMIAKFTVRLGEPISYSILPILIDNESSPQRASEEAAKKIREFLSRTSEEVASGNIRADWWYKQIAQTYVSNSLASYKKRLRNYGPVTILEMAMWLLHPTAVRCWLSLFVSKLRKRRSES